MDSKRIQSYLHLFISILLSCVVSRSDAQHYYLNYTAGGNVTNIFKEFPSSYSPTLTSSPNSGCLPDSVSVSTSFGAPATWSTGEELTAEITLFPQLEDSIGAVVFVGNNCRVDLVEYFQFDPLPQPNTNWSFEGDAISGGAIILTNGAPEDLQFVWSSPDVFFLDGSTSNEVETLLPEQPTADVSFYAINEFGCVGDTFTYTIDIDYLQQVELAEGWNLASSFVEPNSPLPGDVFGSAIGAPLLEVRDELSTYQPNFPLSDLGDFDVRNGYWINVDESTNWPVRGWFVDPESTTISLESGWNLMGYTARGAYSGDIGALFPGLLEIRSEESVYDPSIPDVFNTLEHLEPGQGYWVRMASPLDFTFPYQTPSQLILEQTRSTDHGWQAVHYPSSTAGYGEVLLNGSPVEGEAWVGAFVDGECRAVGEVRASAGETFTTLVMNGTDASEVHFQLYCNGEYYQTDYATELEPGSTHDGLMPLHFGSSTELTELSTEVDFGVFPNPSPSVPLVTVSGFTKPIALTLHSASGQMLVSTRISSPRIKTPLFELFGNTALQLTPGVYFLTAQNDALNQTIQVVILD